MESRNRMGSASSLKCRGIPILVVQHQRRLSSRLGSMLAYSLIRSIDVEVSDTVKPAPHGSPEKVRRGIGGPQGSSPTAEDPVPEGAGLSDQPWVPAGDGVAE